jgi:hypothetical protein
MEDNGYLTTSWQAFVQQIIHNASHGYHYYNYYTLAENRHKNLPSIDQTIITRFDSNKSKDKRYHAKKAGLANYKYLRHELMFIIMRTEGKTCDETQFKHIGRDALILRIGSELELKLYRKADKGVTVRLSNDCYRKIKYEMLELLEHRHIEKLKYKFNALNGIPAYAGMIEHKRQLLKELLKSAKKQQIPLKRSDFKLNTKLTRVKIFTT